ncbi:MAG: UDP-N-acetylglucosamine 1-carboxyvinyltransferase, partial [Lentisphaeria bacterium]|nr:UDP-N-acetylglucosamine 1-carboxyvinyltransferase [Lentisphaeria bacterium]NQZ69879.1 UDP-N-acetylglucosamine 1-carboxyvinyltransferase [Lentisphaeria bacterium]
MAGNEFIINGGNELKGELTASGNKNAILPILAATLLTDEEVILQNVPDIADVRVMLEMLEVMGAEISRDNNQVSITNASIKTSVLPEELCQKIRTSILFAGPMLHRTGHAKLSAPGGDGIGRRRLDAHFYGLRSMGAEVFEYDMEFKAEKRLIGAELFFDEASVTATEHILMTAVLAEGTTSIRNAASEPHVQDLVQFLIALGADIKGETTNTLIINGVDKLHGGEHRIASDHIEVGSYLALVAATGGEIRIHDVVKSHYWMINRIFNRFNIELEFEDGAVFLEAGQTPKVQSDIGGVMPRIDDGPWPQFPSDLMSVMLVLATQAEGAVLFFEKMFESRMYFVDPLIQMGANIIVCDPHRVVVSGRTNLRGQTLRSPDIRAGMALLMAALCANGKSLVQNAHIIDRGYEGIEHKL